MLFYPGAISQTLATILFFVLIIGGPVAYVYISYQKAMITSLQKKVNEYQAVVSAINDKEAYFKKSIEILQRNCNRAVKPAVTGGKLNVENLFNNEPR
jgi:predicted negative regulator of RcsB-dependent stress response